MTRRDFAIVFWAYVGIELLVGGFVRLAALFPVGGTREPAVPAAFQATNLALSVLFVAAGAWAILRRSRLAGWLLAAGGEGAKGDRAASPFAWDLAALGVAAIGFSRLIEGLSLLPWALASAQTLDGSGFASAQERGYFLSGFVGLAVGVVLIASRRKIGARILYLDEGKVAPRPLAGTASELPALGFALLGLAWAMAQVPQLAVYAFAGTLLHAFSGPWWANPQALDLVTRVAYFACGLALFLSRGRLASRWGQGGRELPRAADLLERREPGER